MERAVWLGLVGQGGRLPSFPMHWLGLPELPSQEVEGLVGRWEWSRSSFSPLACRPHLPPHPFRKVAPLLGKDLPPATCHHLPAPYSKWGTWHTLTIYQQPPSVRSPLSISIQKRHGMAPDPPFIHVSFSRSWIWADILIVQ